MLKTFEVEEIGSWRNFKLTLLATEGSESAHSSEIWSWKYLKLNKFEVKQIWSWTNLKLKKYEVEEIWSWNLDLKFKRKYGFVNQGTDCANFPPTLNCILKFHYASFPDKFCHLWSHCWLLIWLMVNGDIP